MIDPGLIAIGIIVAILTLAIWSWRSKKGPTAPTDHTPTQPGRRLDGIDNVGGGGFD